MGYCRRWLFIGWQWNAWGFQLISWWTRLRNYIF